MANQPTNQIKTVFSEHFPIKVTKELVQALTHYVEAYETRGTHALAFNTYSMGIYSCYFTKQDQDNFFEIFNSFNVEVSAPAIKKLIAVNAGRKSVFGVQPKSFKVEKDLITAPEIRRASKNITAINSQFSVISDPFNLFVPYTIHCLITATGIPKQAIYTCCFKLLMILQYKFFTSLVNHYFKHKPKESVMEAMFENLSNKFDIKIYGTWRRVFEARAEQLLTENSIHFGAIHNFDVDADILYLISDIQNRVRSQVKNVTIKFYETLEDNDKIEDYGTVGSTVEGEKIVVDNLSAYDAMAVNIYNDALNINKFLNENYIRLITKMFTNLTTTNFRKFLEQFSEYATLKARAGESNATLTKKGIPYELLIGPEILIHTIIQKSYRYCMQNNVNLKPLEILRALKDVYSSSRISDPGILQIRATMAHLVLELQDSRREVVLSALRIAFVIYIIILSFKFLKE